jgi:hypothetical protein
MTARIPRVTRLLRLAPAAAAAALLSVFLPGAACTGAMKKPEQGIYGTFLTYGPPRELADCTPFKTQFEIDECRRANERVIEEPHQAEIKIRNLQTGAVSKTSLDPQGAYRVVLDPGEYEVCVAGECSDPMTVRMNDFVTYGQRLPRASAAPADTAKGVAVPAP